MSLLFKLLAASDSRPKLREKQEEARRGGCSEVLDLQALVDECGLGRDRQPGGLPAQSSGGDEAQPHRERGTQSPHSIRSISARSLSVASTQTSRSPVARDRPCTARGRR